MHFFAPFLAMALYGVAIAEPLRSNWQEFMPIQAFKAKVKQPLSTKLFEGDIKHATPKDVSAFNALVDRTKRWKGGVVPYEISTNYTASEQKELILAMRTIESKSCITFEKRRKQRDYVKFMPGEGCSSYIGRVGMDQEITLDQDGCIYQGIIMHEILHALGFYHEQNRSDRDNYVFIDLSNVISGNEDNFKKERTDNLGTKYDYNSVMHYPADAFAKDESRPTIVPKKKGTKMGQRDELTATDIEKINKFYGCKIGNTTAEKFSVVVDEPPYPGCTSWWTIRPNESCLRIGPLCKMNPFDIFRLNPDKSLSCDNLKVGEKICCSTTPTGPASDAANLLDRDDDSKMTLEEDSTTQKPAESDTNAPAFSGQVDSNQNMPDSFQFEAQNANMNGFLSQSVPFADLGSGGSFTANFKRLSAIH